MESDLQTERITRLERSNRRLRVWLVILTLALVVGEFLMPFSLVQNPFGKQRIGWSTFPDVAVQAFWNAKAERRLELGTVGKGEPVVYLLDQSERLRLGMDLQPEPTLTLRDQGGEARIRMTLEPDGSPRLSLMAPPGKGGIFMGMQADGNPILKIIDKDGNLLIQVPSVEEPAPTGDKG